MAGGKGGSTTQTTNFTPEMQKGIADAINLAQRSAIPYMPMQGATIAAKTGGMMAGDQGLNLTRSALGLPNTTSSLPEAQDYNGVMAYSSYPMYQAEMARAKENYPDIFSKIEDLQNNPWKTLDDTASADLNAAIAPTSVSSNKSSSSNDKNPVYNPSNPDSLFSGSMFENSPTSIDLSYNPVSDFVDYISGGYSYPEMSDSDTDYYNDPTSAFNTAGGWHPTD